jgi:excisionase family DNA binding protein
MTDSAESTQLLTVVEVTRELRVSRPTVYKLMAEEGGLKSVRIGNRRLIRRSDLTAFVETMEVAQ